MRRIDPFRCIISWSSVLLVEIPRGGMISWSSIIHRGGNFFGIMASFVHGLVLPIVHNASPLRGGDPPDQAELLFET